MKVPAQSFETKGSSYVVQNETGVLMDRELRPKRIKSNEQKYHR